MAERLPDAVRYALDLSRKNYEALGFIPAPRIEQYHRAGQLLVAQENDEACGFLIYGSGWPVLRVYQACVQVDAQRREHATALVGRLIQRALAVGCEAITLRCADGLESNEFWRAVGFTFTGQSIGGERRGRKINHWMMRLPTTDLFTSAAA